MENEKICSILWELSPFKILANFVCLRNEVDIFNLILLKLAQFYNHCKISPIENRENLSNSMGKGLI